MVGRFQLHHKHNLKRKSQYRRKPHLQFSRQSQRRQQVQKKPTGTKPSTTTYKVGSAKGKRPYSYDGEPPTPEQLYINKHSKSNNDQKSLLKATTISGNGTLSNPLHDVDKSIAAALFLDDEKTRKSKAPKAAGGSAKKRKKIPSSSNGKSKSNVSASAKNEVIALLDSDTDDQEDDDVICID